MIKYLGSKRRLVPVLGELAARAGAATALDLCTGTTRVAQELKRRGLRVTAVDSARYAALFAECYIATDARSVDRRRLERRLAELSLLPGVDGYVTRTFCEEARFFQPHNGRRIDAIRDELEAHRDDPLFPVLLTSLIEAADRVDSTTGVQMAYVKRWSSRSYKDLELRVPELLDGPGRAVRGDVLEVVPALPPVDLAYLDPPYNQHRYLGNYHVWETLVAWDAPEHYGVACKRADLRDPDGRTRFDSRRTFPAALAELVTSVPADVLVLSYNDESWLSLDDLLVVAGERGHVRALAFDSRRYVGAQIGIHDPAGRKVGEPGRLRNVEYVLVAGDRERVDHMVAPFT